MMSIYSKYIKQTLLVLLLGHCSLLNFAATYYVSNAGNDSNSGLSTSLPWQTLTKVNSSAFKPGDQILFKCGDTFYGTIVVSGTGNSSLPVTYSSYGSGNKPVITGFTTITGWTNEGNGIYSKLITSESQTNMVTIDGVQYGMGRYPNSTYLKYESCSTNVSITDNELSGSLNWTGAEAVIRKNNYSMVRTRITNHSANTLFCTALTGTLNATANYGYFIQNDLRTLDQFGEWYHDISSNKFYMYFGAIDPTIKDVKVATLSVLISNSTWKHDYITIDNISISGCIKNAVDAWQWYNNNMTIQNCDIAFAGAEGIHLRSRFGKINNNTINTCNLYGIYNYNNRAEITNNNIRNIGIIKGQGISSGVGINISTDSVIVSNNVIENIGYDGITIGRIKETIVKNNFINNTCLVLSDGGAIYTDGNHTNLLIDGNIITNVIGNIDGTPSGAGNIVEGIYLDEYCNGVIVENNTVASCAYSGIKLHMAHDNIIRDNTCFNNRVGIYVLNSSSGTENNELLRNKFIAKTSTQLTIYLQDTRSKSVNFGTANYNYYARPINDVNTIMTNHTIYEGNVYRTSAQWQTLTGQDANSQKSPQSITFETDLQFEYNATKAAKVVVLNQPMIDVKGTKYVGSLTLQPFTSVVLMKDNNPAKVSVTTSEYKSICEGANYYGWTLSGKYERKLVAKSGSDSIATTYLTVNPKYSVTENITITEGENYNGWTTAGQYSRKLNSVSGCDSIVTTNLQVAINSTKQADIEYTQTIVLVKGYNLISTYIAAPNPDASAVTKVLREQNLLVRLQDEAGNSLENWGTYGGWINQLGAFRNTEGYKIQVANDCSLQVNGKSVSLPMDITLKTGWNIISFPSTDLVNAMNVIQPLIDQNLLMKVQDEAGNSIENWGTFGGWRNGIGNFIPGKAYKVEMKADATLTIQENYPKSAVVLAQTEKTEYFTTRIEGNGTDHMNINIVGLDHSGISIGDELAAFDGDICVGSLKITEANFLSTSASLITSFSTDILNQNGFKADDPIRIVAWNKLSGEKLNVNAEVINGQMNYKKNASVLINLKSLSTGVTNIDDALKIDVFPNPSNGLFTVRFSEMPNANSIINILDISGRKIASRLVTQSSEVFNLEEQAPGLYLVKTTMDSKEKVRKLIIN